MTRADIVEKVRKESGFSKKESEELVESFFELIKSILASGENLKVSGFGSFEVRQKAERQGRNPQTGDAIVISSRRILTFKPSPVLKASMNK
jgi:integration host factor subunit alpha